MMTKEDVIGQIVVLDEKFVNGMCKEDKNAPIKSARPYLIVQLKWNSKLPLFAIPIQTNVSSSMSSEFFEKLPKRLDTRSNCDCGFLFGQMVPITANFVAEKKGADRYVPREDEKQDIVFRNMCFGNGDNIPENVKPDFQKCQYLMRRFGMSAFENKNFQNSYKVVANRIFEKTIEYVNGNFDKIREKAQNYLDRYHTFYEEIVCKKNKDFQIQMPIQFTRINKLVRYLHRQNMSRKESATVHTSIQPEQPKQPELPAELKEISSEYGISPEKCVAIKKVADNSKLDVKVVARSFVYDAKDGTVNKQAQSKVRAEVNARREQRTVNRQVSTQEKINNQQQVTAKSKRKDSDQNSR